GQFASYQRLCLFNRIESGELKDDAAILEPVLFKLQSFAPPIGRDCYQSFKAVKAFGEVRQKLCNDFAAKPPRPDNKGDCDQLFTGCIMRALTTLAHSTISRT